MIAFTTIFLGLVLGLQEVELTVGDGVTSVEVFLNGHRVGTLAAAPWELECDLGDELKPQELVAVAHGAGGEELARVRQWINLPQPPARVSVALDGGDGGEPRVAHLTWESRVGSRPQAFKVSLDGVPLEVEHPERVVLPPHDARQLHFLRVELEFSDNVTSVSEVTFGGTYADQVSTELTAVPVLAKGGKARKEGALDGLILKKGEPVRVVAVDQGPALVVVVPDRAISTPLQSMRTPRGRGMSPLSPPAVDPRSWASFGKDQVVRFLWPTVQRQQGRTQQYDLFPTSREYKSNVGGMYFLLRRVLREPPGGEQRLADAVAVAGLHAVEQRQRRAVVLLVGEPNELRDPSQLTPTQARRYLEHLRVRFEVWSFSKGAGSGPWGKVRDVSSADRLARAVDQLSRHLDRQHLVWLDGIHLPQEIELAPEADGLELVR